MKPHMLQRDLLKQFIPVAVVATVLPSLSFRLSPTSGISAARSV